MKKELKEKNTKNITIDILLYLAITIIGYILMNFPWNTNFNPTEDIASLFYIFAFFSILAYFLDYTRNDYEFLIFGLINVITGTFILYYMNYPDTGFVIVDAVLIYSLANILNKGYHARKMLIKKDLNALPKVAITTLLTLLGLFVVSSLYNRVEFGYVIVGYYFILFGLLSLFEPLLSIVLSNRKVEKYLMTLLSYELDEPQPRREKAKINVSKTKVKRIQKRKIEKKK